MKSISGALKKRRFRQTTAGLALAYQKFSKESAQMAEEWHTLGLNDWDEKESLW